MSSEGKASAAISEEEAQLYDRQIRLWGLESQKRLRASRVLVAGMKGLGCEVAKNLVLAGVKSLTALDHEPLTEEDFESQFLAPRDRLGANRARASLERLKALNPGVEVCADEENLDSKAREFYADRFDVIIVTHYPKDVAVKVNGYARSAGAKFFCGDIFGFFGFAFFDLGSHEFVEEIKAVTEEAADAAGGDGPSPAKKAKKTEEAKAAKRTIQFVNLESALKVDWTSAPYKNRLRRMDASAYFLMLAVFEFQSREGRSPSASHRDADISLLKRLVGDVGQKHELPGTVKLLKDVDEHLELVFSELSPVAAIVGGVLAQEVIKCVSQKDEPLNNFFLYNPLESAGCVEAVGSA